MRLGSKRRLAFLLTWSLLLSNARAEPGFMDLSLRDRYNFLYFVSVFFSVQASIYLKSIYLRRQLSEEELHPARSELERLDQLWIEHHTVFRLEELNLYPPSLSEEEIGRIDEIAPGICGSKEDRKRNRRVRLPVGATMRSLLVKIARGEDIEDTLADLLIGDREQLEELLNDADRIKCEKIRLLLEESAQKLRQKIAGIAPGLAPFMEAIEELVSENMLNLLAQVAAGKNTDDTVAQLSKHQREELKKEAESIQCKKIVCLLMGAGESDSESSHSTPSPSPRSKKTNDNGHNIQSFVPEKPRKKVTERRQSISLGRRRPLVEKKEKRTPEPIPTIPNPTLIEQLLQFAPADEKPNIERLLYCPGMFSDKHLVKTLEKLDFTTKEHFDFVNALVNFFELKGFPNESPSPPLLKFLREMLADSFDARLGKHLKIETESSSH